MDDDLLGILFGLDDHDAEVRETYLSPAFGYPGSKAKAIRNILPHLPYTSMYCEPFGGSGAILLARRPSRLEVFNDRFSGVTSFYRALRDRKEELIERLSVLIHSREEFIWSQRTWKDCGDIVERAARWYYCVRNSFGSQGLYFGRSKNPKALFANKLHTNLNLFHTIHERIKNVQIENLTWQHCFTDYDHDDCVWYLDPPYYKATKGMYECELPDEEHVELLERAWNLKGFVAVSGYANDLYSRFPWSYIYTWEQASTTLGIANTQSNNLSGVVLERGTATEVLYIR